MPVRKKKTPADIVYVFKNICVDCTLNPDIYSESDRKAVLNILRSVTREIWIDGTYVDFDGTRYEKTFLHPEGWNALRDLVIETKYGKKCAKNEQTVMIEAYKAMITGYLEMFFTDLGWNTDEMDFKILNDPAFEVEYYSDTSESWRKYAGKWQLW